MIEFGERIGTWLALMLFAGLFAMLAGAVALTLMRRGMRRRPAWLTGAFLFVGPLWLVYASSLDGFYAIETDGDGLVLHYLMPPATELAAARVADVQLRPAFRGRWRLHIVDRRGAEYASATSSRATVTAAAAELRSTLRLGNR